MDSGGTTTADQQTWVEIAGVRVPADSVFAQLDDAIDALAESHLRPADAPTAAKLTKVIEYFARGRVPAPVQALRQPP